MIDWLCYLLTWCLADPPEWMWARAARYCHGHAQRLHEDAARHLPDTMD